ncbi:MAG: formylglycine-generating enzyme family protein, partial [Pirellulales bacterium]
MKTDTPILTHCARWPAALLLPGVCLLLGCAGDASKDHATARAQGTPINKTIFSQDGAEMVVIPAMDFLMGTGEAHPDWSGEQTANTARSPIDVLAARAAPGWSHVDERPAHRVKLRSFAIDRFEVTNARYLKFLNAITQTDNHHLCHPDEPDQKDHTPRYWRSYNPLLANPAYAKTAPFRPDTFLADEKPVVGVDWYDAYAYAQPPPGMVRVPAGEFLMGADHGGLDEAPRHPVFVSEFYIDRYEVTTAQFAAFVRDSSSFAVVEGPWFRDSVEGCRDVVSDFEKRFGGQPGKTDS